MLSAEHTPAAAANKRGDENNQVGNNVTSFRMTIGDICQADGAEF
jgi:hypothetical protein